MIQFASVALDRNLEAQGALNFYKQINPYLQIIENQLKCEQD